MKVLFTLDTLMGGGTETSTLELIKRFDSSIDVTVSYFYPKHDLLTSYRAAGIKVQFLDLKGSYSFLTGIRKLLQLIQLEQPDVLVTSLYRASIISRIASFITGIPLVDTMVNDSYGEGKRKEFPGLQIGKFWSVYLLDRITAFIPKLWVSNSVYLAKQLGKQLGIEEKKIKVVYRGRDVQQIYAWEFPAADKGFHIISIGRLYKQKAQSDLIRSFVNLKQIYPDIRLTILGEGPERSSLEQLINELNLTDNVFLPGRVPDAWRQLYTAHCFVLPSFYEGFSGALVEALLTGIPVVVSDIPMNQEAVEHEASGLIYKTGDISELTEKIKQILNNYEVAIKRGKQARKDSMCKYSIEKITRTYQSLLLSCTNDRNKPLF